jgi:hypothetical protein
MTRRALVMLLLAVIAAPALAKDESYAKLPPEFNGLWVVDEADSCPVLERDDDAYGMGEDRLLLRGDRFYSHESLCHIRDRLAQSCCNGENERTVAVNYSCGARHAGRVTLYLRHTRDGGGTGREL